MSDQTDDTTDDGDENGSDERRMARREKWKKALRNSFLDHVPQASEQSARSGAELDNEIAALEQRMTAVETKVATNTSAIAALDTRVKALEAGEPVTPPVEPPIEPPVEPPAGKRYPTGLDDPMCGIPANTILKPQQSGFTASQAGKVYDGLDINGTVTIQADNVEFKNCRIRFGFWGFNNQAGKKGLKVHHCDLIGPGPGSGGSGCNGVGYYGYNKITKCENGLNFWGNDGIIEWNVIDQMSGPSSAHKDNLQCDGGINGLIIRHNYLNNGSGETSACMLDNWGGAMNNVEVHDNFLGGGGYPAYIDGSFQGASKMTNVVYHHNVMRKGGWNGYFYWKSAGSGCAHRDNVDWQTGASADG